MLLTQLPVETIHQILSLVEPEDLGNVASTCRSLNNFIKGNNALCRDIYLRILDEPPTRDLDFEQELRDFVRLRALCSPDIDVSDEQRASHLRFVHSTVTRLLKHAATAPPPTPSATGSNVSGKSARRARCLTYPDSRTAAVLEELFKSPAVHEAFLSRSFLFERARAMKLLHSPRGRDSAEADPAPAPQGSGNGDSNSDGDGDGDGNGNDEGSAGRWPRQQLRRPAEVSADHQASAHLHCLYGCSLALAAPRTNRCPAGCCAWGRRVGPLYRFACSKVYDLREYTTGNKWGPFLEDDGSGAMRVDWEKVEAILIVLGTNIRKKGLEGAWLIFENVWGTPFAGVWPRSYIPWWSRKEGSAVEMGELARRDPFGVSGSWLRVVCFIDFGDFVAHNFPLTLNRLPADIPRPPLNVAEATRLTLMRVYVTKIEPPGASDHPDYPVVHFAGFSRSLDGSWDGNADSDLRGTVRMTPQGEVWWTLLTILSGEERWKSEGIQLGGIQSARGLWEPGLTRTTATTGLAGQWHSGKCLTGEPKSSDPRVVLLNDLLPILDEVVGGEDDWNDSFASDEWEEELSNLDIGIGWDDDEMAFGWHADEFDDEDEVEDDDDWFEGPHVYFFADEEVDDEDEDADGDGDADDADVY